MVFLCALQGQQIRSISPGQQWPGFSFALYLLRVQGFCFALLQYNPIQAFTARFASSMQLYRQRHKTAHKALQVFFLLFDPFNRSRYQTDTSGYNTACATPDAAQVSAAAYYNKVYRGEAVQHTADHASPAGSAPTVCGSLASATPGVSTEGSTSPPVQGQPGGAEPLAALAASLFGLSPDS